MQMGSTQTGAVIFVTLLDGHKDCFRGFRMIGIALASFT